MKLFISAVIFLLIGGAALAQTGAPQEQIADFHQKLCGDAERVITDYINPLTSNPDVIANFRDQFAFLNANYGACNGFETFEVNEFSPSVHLYKCFFKFERTPVVFKFIFYKYKNAWQLNSVNFSDSLGEELGEK